jgi:hypothetical protein
METKCMFQKEKTQKKGYLNLYLRYPLLKIWLEVYNLIEFSCFRGEVYVLQHPFSTFHFRAEL